MTRGVTQAELHRAVDADALQWRVADTINFAVHWWQHHVRSVRCLDPLVEEGRVDVQLAAILITYAHRQGLSPADLDNDNGLPALRALAEAIASDFELRRTLKTEIVKTMYGGKPTPFDGEWGAVQRASQHLLERQARRYAGEYT